MRFKFLAFIFVPFLSSWSAGCEKGRDRSVEVCAMYTSCIDRETSLSECLYYLKSVLPMSYRHLMNTFDPEYVSLSQNMQCVANAWGDCNKVLACLNMGNVVTDCAYERTCVDSQTMSVCVEFNGAEYTRGEIAVRCEKSGSTCVGEVGQENAFCGEPDSSPGGMEVTCEGNIGQLHSGNSSVYFDCSVYAADCKEGPVMVPNLEPCEGTGTSCDGDSFRSRCEGNTRVVCIGDKRSFIDCGAHDLFCRQTASSARCSFDGCDPNEYIESCDGDTITYCGPEGEAELSCNELGFSGCSDEPVIGVHCIN